jgi:hypothetical protein
MRLSVIVPRDNLEELRLELSSDELQPPVDPKTIASPKPILVVTWKTVLSKNVHYLTFHSTHLV